MAQKVVTIITDDLTGEESSEVATHRLGLDGIEYEIDLAPDSYDQLLEALSPFTRSGRRVTKARKPQKRKAALSRDDSTAIRTWAKQAGYEVSERGRVPATVREAYDEAH
ncbi:histone-like nucleoid-structuring protein Lsr2 [Streptomyces noursei]|uniref:Nucleoid-associated protein Lsr2 n=1 Tax=Streptomyces noursei TaxID=1971 RepID=A0A2N8PFV5_STRNR|nr:Lsr2 family protein [Streptomyces noursei]PNE39876.1 hypothetical protein AOB60_01750 [Streptomyces noursei]